MGFFDKIVSSAAWGFGWNLGGRAANDVYDKAKEAVIGSLSDNEVQEPQVKHASSSVEAVNGENIINVKSTEGKDAE